MDRRNHPPAAFWGESLNFWCRLWQAQIEQSLRFWGTMAAQLPRPTSAQLASEAESIAESMKATRKPVARGAAPARATAAKPVAVKTAPTKLPRAKPIPVKPAGKPATKPGGVPLQAPVH